MNKKQKAAEIKKINKAIKESQPQAKKNVEDDKFLMKLSNKSEHRVDVVSQQIKNQIEETVDKYYSNLGEFRVDILDYVPVENAGYNRVGYVDIQMQPGYAEVGIWMEEEKKKFWYDFCEFNYNQTVPRRDEDKWGLPWNANGMVHNLELGTGIIRLWVRKDDSGEFYVRLPMDKGRGKDEFYDIIHTSDIRWGRPNSANNGNFEAAVTAALRFYLKTLKMENPQNRYDIDPSCMKCRNMDWFGTRDGLDDDMHLSVRPAKEKGEEEAFVNPKSRRILNAPDVEALRHHGTHITQAFCNKRKFFVDADAVGVVNGMNKEGRKWYTVEVIDEITGEVRLEQRYQGADEVLLGGQAKKVSKIREVLTQDVCNSCLFFHKNEHKGEHQLGKEVVEVREKRAAKAKNDQERANAYRSRVWTNDYWATRARAGRQMFETLLDVDGKQVWVQGFPSEVTKDMDKVLDIRVAGIGVNVYFGDRMMSKMANPDFAYTPAIEVFDSKKAEFEKAVSMIYYAVFHRKDMDRDKFEQVNRMVFVTGMPEGVTEDQAKRWEKAVETFKKSLQWAAERIAAATRPAFTQKFFAGMVDYMKAKGLTEEPDLQALGVKEIHIEDVLADIIYRMGDNKLHDMDDIRMMKEFGMETGFEDHDPKDFVRYLEISGSEDVMDALVDGYEFVIVGGREDVEKADGEDIAHQYGIKDKFAAAVEALANDAGLVADTLQLMLQRQINGVIYGVNYAEDKAEAFLQLKITAEDVLEYIAQHTKLM